MPVLVFMSFSLVIKNLRELRGKVKHEIRTLGTFSLYCSAFWWNRVDKANTVVRSSNTVARSLNLEKKSWNCSLHSFSNKSREIVLRYSSLWHFLTFPVCFKIPIIFSNFDYNCSIFLDVRNLQEQVKKTRNCSDLYCISANSFLSWIVSALLCI